MQVPEIPKLSLKTELKIKIFPGFSSSNTDPSVCFLLKTALLENKLFLI